MSILEKLERFHRRVFDPVGSQGQSKRSGEGADAGAAATAHRGVDPGGASAPVASYPPGYVKQDDGRPRH
jgi:hypothetical protein